MESWNPNRSPLDIPPWRQQYCRTNWERAWRYFYCHSSCSCCQLNSLAQSLHSRVVNAFSRRDQSSLCSKASSSLADTWIKCISLKACWETLGMHAPQNRAGVHFRKVNHVSLCLFPQYCMSTLSVSWISVLYLSLPVLCVSVFAYCYVSSCYRSLCMCLCLGCVCVCVCILFWFLGHSLWYESERL